MPVNSGLADAANALLFTTVILYALAMLSYACDFAFARQRVLATESVPELVAAGAGGPAVVLRDGGETSEIPAGKPAGGLWPAGGWLRLAFGLTCIGVILHVLAIATRGLA